MARRSLTASLDRIAELAQSLALALDDRAEAGALTGENRTIAVNDCVSR